MNTETIKSMKTNKDPEKEKRSTDHRLNEELLPVCLPPVIRAGRQERITVLIRGAAIAAAFLLGACFGRAAELPRP